MLSALSPYFTPGEGDREAVELKAHSWLVPCLFLAAWHKPAWLSSASVMPNQSLETASTCVRSGPGHQLLSALSPVMQAAIIRATEVLTCLSLAHLPDGLSLSIPAPGVGVEGSISERHVLG